MRSGRFSHRPACRSYVSPTVLFLTLCLFLLLTPEARAQVPYGRTFLPAASYLQQSYPSYQDVAETFYQRHQTTQLPEYFRYNFLKAPEGWFVYEHLPYEPEQSRNFELFWSAEKRQYLPLTVPLLPKGAPAATYELPAEPELINFNQQPFYGYPGWHNDVISLLKQVPDPTPDQLNSLARAYSYKATSLISPRAAYQKLTAAFLQQVRSNSLPEKQVQEGVEAYRMAIETYRKLAHAAPAYVTPIGTSTLKLWHEQVVAYLDLSQIGKPNLARAFLDNELYNAFYLNFAKNLLNSCAPNAILFVGGDTDLFPLLYAQEKLAIRPDITVVNLSLANSELYLHYLLERLPAPHRIRSTLGLAPYATEHTNYLLLPDKQTGANGEVAELLQAIGGKNANVAALNEASPYWELGARTWRVQLPQGQKSSFIEIAFDGQYIERSQLFLLDLLQSNTEGRPVYLAQTVNNASLLPLKPYLRAEGLAYRLTAAAATSAAGEIPLDVPATTQFLKTKFSMEGSTRSQVHDLSGGFSSLVALQRKVFEETCSELLRLNRKPESLQIAQQCLQQLPASLSPYDYYTTGLAAPFYANKLTTAGDQILQQLLKQTDAFVKAMKQSAADQDPTEVQLYAYMSNRMMQVASQYKRTSIYTTAEQHFNVIYSGLK